MSYSPFNTNDIWGLLPILSTGIFTLFMGINDDKKFKKLVASTVVLWIIYDLVIHNYVAFVFDVLTLISSSLALLKMNKK